MRLDEVLGNDDTLIPYEIIGVLHSMIAVAVAEHNTNYHMVSKPVVDGNNE